MGWVVEVVRREIGPYPAMQRYLERARPARLSAG